MKLRRSQLLLPARVSTHSRRSLYNFAFSVNACAHPTRTMKQTPYGAGRPDSSKEKKTCKISTDGCNTGATWADKRQRGQPNQMSIYTCHSKTLPAPQQAALSPNSKRALKQILGSFPRRTMTRPILMTMHPLMMTARTIPDDSSQSSSSSTSSS